MLWIHGGGTFFLNGASNYYPGDVLGAFGDVIVVTLNYRVGHLGFLRSNNVIGNFGFWDMHMALRWVSHNIRAFGGDPSRVTLFGQSQKSTSVIYQAMYPGNVGLFHRAIAMSGSITSHWAFASNESASN